MRREQFLRESFWSILSEEGFPGGSENSPTDTGDTGSIFVLGRSLRGGHGIPLQYSYLENAMDRGAWWATVHGGHKESDMTEAT